MDALERRNMMNRIMGIAIRRSEANNRALDTRTNINMQNHLDSQRKAEFSNGWANPTMIKDMMGLVPPTIKDDGNNTFYKSLPGIPRGGLGNIANGIGMARGALGNILSKAGNVNRSLGNIASGIGMTRTVGGILGNIANGSGMTNDVMNNVNKVINSGKEAARSFGKIPGYTGPTNENMPDYDIKKKKDQTGGMSYYW